MTEAEKVREDAWRERVMTRAILTAVALLFSHLVDLQPSELSAVGIKVAISDPAMIRGAIAVLMLHYSTTLQTTPVRWRSLRARAWGHARNAMEALPRKRRRSLNFKPVIRLQAGFWIGLYQAHALAKAVILMVASGFALVDAFKFARLVFHTVVAPLS